MTSPGVRLPGHRVRAGGGPGPGASCPFPSGQQTSLSWHRHQILGSRANSSPGWERGQEYCGRNALPCPSGQEERILTPVDRLLTTEGCEVERCQEGSPSEVTEVSVATILVRRGGIPSKKIRSLQVAFGFSVSFQSNCILICPFPWVGTGQQGLVLRCGWVPWASVTRAGDSLWGLSGRRAF